MGSGETRRREGKGKEEGYLGLYFLRGRAWGERAIGHASGVAAAVMVAIVRRDVEDLPKHHRIYPIFLPNAV